MASVTEQIEALREAIASGATRVSYGDKSIEYRDLKEMRQILNSLLAQAGMMRPRAAFARFTRGDR